MANEQKLQPGFKDPVHEAQNVFRTLLHVMSHPGELQKVDTFNQNDLPLNPVMAATALTLLDYETPYWLSESLNHDEISSYITFHTGASKVTDSKDAAFIFVGEIPELPAMNQICLGTPDYPDKSASIIINTNSFETGKKVQLSGPGIETTCQFQVQGLQEDFWSIAQENHKQYPLGVDFIFCSTQGEIAALPRSTKMIV